MPNFAAPTIVPPVTDNPVYSLLSTGLFQDWRATVPGYRPAGGPDWLLILTLAGGGIVQTSKQTMHDPQIGDLFLYRPHTPQWYWADAEKATWTLVWAHFQPRPHWLEWLHALPEIVPGLLWLKLDQPTFSGVRRNLLAMHRQATNMHRSSPDHAMNRLEAALLLCRDAAARSAATLRTPPISKVLTWLDRRLAAPPTVTEMAAIAGLSVSCFAHRFRTEVGLAPLRYIDWRRLERAKDLLRLTPLTVKEVASELGFADPFYFSRRFRQSTGISPVTWRRQTHSVP